MTGKTTDPRIFISYSWSSPQHEKWVIDLAERLCTDGIDTVLDKWDLKEGQDKFHFMEQMVRDAAITKVLMICDQVYADKADGRLGGVGTESQIISKEIYDNTTQEKFIPLVVQLNADGKACLPTFVGSRIYFDFTEESKFEDSYEKLLRNIYNRPRHQKPTRGVMPSYLQEEGVNHSFRCISIQKQLRNALMKDHQSATGLLDDFLDSVIVHLEEDRQFQIENAIDERTLNGINRLLPLRDAVIDAVNDLCKYRQTVPVEKIKEFLEKSLQFNYHNSSMRSWGDSDFDIYKFFNLELMLYVLTVLIKRQRYAEASEIIYAQYFFVDGNKSDDNIRVFNEYMRSLEDVYKRKVNSNLITITGDKIKERCKYEQIKFIDIMATDCLLFFTLSLRNSLYTWYPRTLVYRSYHQTFDIFVRLKSTSHFEKIKPLFGVKNVYEFKDLVKNAISEHSNIRSSSFSERNFPSIEELSKLDLVCTVG